MSEQEKATRKAAIVDAAHRAGETRTALIAEVIAGRTAGLSLREIAQAAGVSVETVRNWTGNGHGRP